MNAAKTKQKTGASWRFLMMMGSLLSTLACSGAATNAGGSSTADASEATATTSGFPSDLAVASPLDVTENDGTVSLSLSSVKFSMSSAHVPTYAAHTAAINQILNTTSPALCVFDPELFLAEETDAECYGPTVGYENHPDASGATDPDLNGELPSGDVGIWEEIDPATGHACAAAELNARMRGVSQKSKAALSGLASMICVINANGLTMPSSSSLDLTADMTALAIADVTFNSATISHEVNADGNDEYSYNLDFNYAPGANSHDIVVDMAHVPGASPAEEYAGQVSYIVTGTGAGGNCPGTDVTDNGSLQYVRHAVDAMDVQVRSGQFCGAGSDGRDVNGLVDPSLKYDASSNPTGWGNDFNLLTANYDPTSLVGDYAYSWQAGPNDGNTRAFNLQVIQLAAVQAAYTFYGYGEDIESTDGSINGFICNWAGAGANHTLVESAQYQAVAFDASTGLFASTASNIGYAPTTSCEYDGSGSFIFDTDGDGSIADESNVAVSDDLFIGTDEDLDGTATIEESIDAVGFTLPTI